MMISAFLTAICGGFYAQYILYIDPPSVLSLDISIKMVLIAVSALAGYVVIAALLAFVRRFSLAIFAVYRLLLGVALLLWF